MPCRFTGVDSFNLCGDDGEWIESYERDLFAYDAGTDSGTTFASENEETSPREPITSFSDVSPQSDSIFYNPEQCATTCCSASLCCCSPAWRIRRNCSVREVCIGFGSGN